MSLNYDLTNCDEATRADENNGLTTAVIFATMSVDMGEITEGNIETFVARLLMVEKVYGSLFLSADGPVTATVDMIRPYIGLKTNVATTTDAKFRGRMAKALAAKAAEEVGGR